MIPPGENFYERYLKITTAGKFENASPSERINLILSVKSPKDPRFSSQFMETDVKLHSFTQKSPTSASAVFKFKVDKFYCNASGNLHGGAQSFIYDMLTSLVVQGIGRRDWWMNGGVSRSLNVTYLRPAPEGTEVLCEVEVMSAGKSLALLRGVMRREVDGALVSTCEHDKAAVATKPGFPAGSKL